MNRPVVDKKKEKRGILEVVRAVQQKEKKRKKK
jgi:hypothetical protein